MKKDVLEAHKNLLLRAFFAKSCEEVQVQDEWKQVRRGLQAAPGRGEVKVEGREGGLPLGPCGACRRERHGQHATCRYMPAVKAWKSGTHVFAPDWGRRDGSRHTSMAEACLRPCTPPAACAQPCLEPLFQFLRLRPVHMQMPQVERVVASREVKRRSGPAAKQYLVKWRGLEYSGCTWEDADELSADMVRLGPGPRDRRRRAGDHSRNNLQCSL